MKLTTIVLLLTAICFYMAIEDANEAVNDPKNHMELDKG
jgi:hypothetical protein